jgi:rSAM/selenodomain-associated transferase 1
LKPRLIVIAKAPVPGMSKTRLCPPCTPAQAAAVAEAALADTLLAVKGVAGVRPVLVLDGTPGRWLPRGIDVIPQRGGGLDQRLAGAFDDCGGPALLIGMDTPQVTPALLGSCVDALLAPGIDAVLGPALDGGWWAAGLRRPMASAFLGVPMSTGHTCDVQRRRLAGLGLHVAELPALSDVDLWEDALSVASGAAGGRFAVAVAAVAGSWVAR